jgi:hypothetical protein
LIDARGRLCGGKANCARERKQGEQNVFHQPSVRARKARLNQ